MSSTAEMQTVSISVGRPARLPRLWKLVLPFMISAGLVTYLVWRVSPASLAQAVARLEWQALVVLTLLLVLGLYVWDALSISWLFSRPQRPFFWRDALHARGFSYLFSALNYELGQGVMAWKAARTQDISWLAAIGYCTLLAVHDLGVLLGLGLIGALLSQEERAESLRWFCGISLLGFASLALLTRRLPVGWRIRLARTRWGSWIDSWTWQRSLQLCALRSVYYAILLAYVLIGLSICHMHVGLRVVFSVIPLVLMVDGLPISISGFGTREATLLYFLKPDQPGTMLAFSLIWSSGLVLGRLALGLVHWWVPLGMAWLRGAACSRERDIS